MEVVVYTYLSLSNRLMGTCIELFTFLHLLVMGANFVVYIVCVDALDHIMLLFWFIYIFMDRDVEVDSVWSYLNLVMLSCILSYLYHNSARSTNDVLLSTLFLVLILHFYKFFRLDPTTSCSTFVDVLISGVRVSS